MNTFCNHKLCKRVEWAETSCQLARSSNSNRRSSSFLYIHVCMYLCVCVKWCERCGEREEWGEQPSPWQVSSGSGSGSLLAKLPTQLLQWATHKAAAAEGNKQGTREEQWKRDGRGKWGLGEEVVTWHADNMCFEVKLINKLLISIWHTRRERTSKVIC